MPLTAAATTAMDLHFGAHRLDVARQQLWRGTEPVAVTPKAWDLLLYLAQRPGHLVPVAELMDALWPGADVTPKALTNRIVELRRALGDDPAAPRTLVTVHRRGYRLMADAPALGGHGTPPGPTTAAPAGSVPATPGGAAAGASLPTGLAAGTGTGRLFVGRQSELATLGRLLAGARTGQRQMALVSGEPGLGKSALLDRFVATLAPDTVRVGRGQCQEQSSAREAFGPFLALLADVVSGPDAAQVLALLRRCAPSWLLQLPWLLDEDEATHLRQTLAGNGAGRMLREGAALLEALAQAQPLVLVLEDLHWSDAATIDLLAYLAQGRAPARLLVLMSLQPQAAARQAHPAQALARRGLAQGTLTELPLQPLSAAEVEAFVAQRFGDAGLVRQLAPLVQRRSDGHPLFLTATVEHLVERGLVLRCDNTWQVSETLGQQRLGLPERLRQVIEARFELLDDAQRQLLQAASVAGMQFSVQLLQAMLNQPAEQLAQACDTLAQRRLFLRALSPVRWPDGSEGSTYAFVHDAYRRALYDDLTPGQRQGLHRRVAQRLEDGYGERAAEVAGQLAGAYARADMPEATARVLEMAAGVSASRFAYLEAAQAIEASLQQAALLPDSPDRTRRTIRLQLTLGNLLVATRGQGAPRTPQALAAYRTAEALAAGIGATREQLRANLGICVGLLFSGQAEQAQHVGRRLVQLAAHQPGLQSVAHTYAGLTQLNRGELQAARGHFELALQLTPEAGVPLLTDVHALAHVQLGRTLVHLGRPAEGMAQARRGLARCRAVGNPFDTVQNLYWTAECHLSAGEATEALRLLDELLPLAHQHAAPVYSIVGQLLRLAARGPALADPSEIAALVAQLHAAGEHWADVSQLLLLARAHWARGDAAAAQASLQAAQQAEATGGLFTPQLRQFEAELLAAEGNAQR